MKRNLFIISLLCCLLSMHTISYAQETDDQSKKTIRLFLNTGETLNFNAAEIDSITTTAETQCIWQAGFCQSFALTAIDSVWYMAPSLRITTKEVNFGKVAVGNRKTTTITITNTGDYPETYSFLAAGVFAAAHSGDEYIIGAGQSLNIDLSFQPKDTINYTGQMFVSSSAVEDGLMQMPLAGIGVTADALEVDVPLPPVEQEFDIVLPEEESLNDLQSFKIVNFNGEYPVEISAMARGIKKVRRNSSTYNSYPVTAYMSPTGLQTHYLTDENGNPYLETTSIPGKKPEFSFENEAISLLMRLPELQTNNLTEYHNAVKLIKGLNSFPSFVSEVRKAFYEGKTRGIPPNYTNLNPLPIFNELLSMSSDTRELRFSGVSLTHVKTTSKSASFRLHNDFRRTIHAYPVRVKMNDTNLLVIGQEEAAPTVREMFEALLDECIEKYKKTYQITEDLKEKTYAEWVERFEGLGLGEVTEDMELDQEDLEFLEIQREFIIDLENQYIQANPALGQLARFHLPYTLKAVNSDYIDMLGDGWDAYVYGIGKESSVFETESGNIEVPFNNYDKIFVNVYGIGKLDGLSFKDMPQEEQTRIILLFLTTGYYDYIEPFWQMVTGAKKADEIFNNEYKFDFRYGKRKYPILALVAKLFNEFNSDIDNIKKLGENFDNRDFKAIFKQLASFIWGEMKKIPKEVVIEKNASEEDKEKYRESKRTYVNLIYNIYKKYSGNRSTSEEFRKTFKKEANKWFQTVNFIFKWMDVAESGVDFAGALEGFKNSKLKETFVLDKSDKPHIFMKEPTATYITSDVTVHFEWETVQGKRYGEYVYDLELMTETSQGVKQTTVLKDITTTHCDYHINDLLFAHNAMKVYYRIIARDKETPSYILTNTEFIPLVWRATMEPPTMVDLGLPSGTLWATTNLGAKQPEDHGNYYAWAETNGYDEGKTCFSWKNYKYCKGAPTTLTKYCTKSSYGQVDHKKQIDETDDIIKNGCGYYYAIPTKEEWDELISNCTWSPFGGIGVLVHSKVNAESIFLPFAGYRSGYDLLDTGSDCYYWSSTLDTNSPDDAWLMHVGNANAKRPAYYDYYRCQGRSIRPILRPASTIPPSATRQYNGDELPSARTDKPVEKHENGLIINTISRTAATR